MSQFVRLNTKRTDLFFPALRKWRKRNSGRLCTS